MGISTEMLIYVLCISTSRKKFLLRLIAHHRLRSLFSANKQLNSKQANLVIIYEIF